MTTTLADVATRRIAPSDPPFSPGFDGLRCRHCGAEAPTGPVFVCSRCFGPLQAAYDYERVAAHLTPEAIGATTASGARQPSCSAISKAIVFEPSV